MKINVGGTCISCNKTVSIEIEESDYERYEAGSVYIQEIPGLTLDEREFLISRICGQCFDRITEEN